MQRPLFSVTLAYVSGIIFCYILPHKTTLLVSLFLFFILGLAAWNNTKYQKYLLLLFFMVGGWINLERLTAIVSPNDIRLIIREEAVLATVRGFTKYPHVEKNRVQITTDNWHTRSKLQLTAIQLQNKNWQPTTGEILIITPGKLTEVFHRDQEVQIFGVLMTPANALVKGLFDYQDHLYWEGIHFQFICEGERDWERIKEKFVKPSMSRRFQLWARATMLNGILEEDEPQRLLYAMSLGWKTSLNGEVAETFMHSGTLHIFAISGLHVGLISYLLVQVLQLLNLSREFSCCIVIPAIWFYAVLTGWQPSAVRATIMISVIMVGWVLKRPSDLLNSLTAAALIILILNPRELFRIGFQLSFSVVLSIGLISPLINRWRDKLLMGDPMLPMELRPRWQRWVNLFTGYISSVMGVSLAATLGSLPVSAFYFNLITPITLIANLFIVPLSGFTLISILSSWITGGWWPAVSILFNNASWFLMNCMMEISHLAAEIPGAYFYVTSPSLIIIIIYYFGLTAGITNWMFHSFKRAIALYLIIGSIILGCTIWNYFKPLERLTIIPTRGGVIIHVDGTRGEDLLIDCGREESLEFITKPFLKSRGINSLPYFVLTHGDINAMGGALKLNESFLVQHWSTSQANFRSSAYADVINFLRDNPDRWTPLDISDKVAGWMLLYPPDNSLMTKADDKAMVLFKEIYGNSIILISELGRKGQNRFLEQHPQLKSDILIAGMPNHDSPVNDAMIMQLQPELIIMCTSNYPVTKRPSKKLRSRLEKYGIPIFFTSDIGGLEMWISSKKTSIKSIEGELWSSN